MRTRLLRVLSVPDIHYPEHDQKSIELMVKVAKDFKPDVCIFLGDVFDMYCISRFEKKPDKDYLLLRDELKDSRILFQDLVGDINAKKTVFLGGNHELRLEKYIANHASRLGGLLKTEDVLGISSKVLYLPYGPKNRYQIGKLMFAHGTRTGAHPAASMVSTYRSSVMFGHVHRIQEYHITDIHGNDFVGLTPGWLGDQEKAGDYLPDISNWGQGFGLTWHKPSGDFFYSLVRIASHKDRRECLFNSVVYSR